MLLIEYIGHIGLRSLTDGHLGRHLDYFKTLNDARVASVGFINYNALTTRINKEKTLKSSSRSFWFSTRLFDSHIICRDDARYNFKGSDIFVKLSSQNCNKCPI